MHDPTVQLSAEASDDLSPKVRLEQIRRLLDAFPSIAFLTSLGAVLLVWAIPRPLADPAVLAWIVVFVLQLLVRLGIASAFRRLQPEPSEARGWFISLVLSALFSGVVWGAGAWLFVGSDYQDIQPLIIITLAGLSAGSVINLGISWQVSWAFLLPMILSFAWKFGISDGEWAMTIAVAMVLFLAALMVMSRRLSALAVDHIQTALRFAALAERTETELRGYRNMIESTLAILWEGRAGSFAFAYISPEAEKLLGYPTESWLVDEDFWPSKMHPEDREWVLEFCRTSTEAGRGYVFDHRMYAADGRVVWLRNYVNITPVENEPTRLVGVMIDISELKEAEAGREQLTRLQGLIVKTSQQFLTAQLDNFDAVLDEALAEVGPACGVDRAYFVRLSDDGETYTNTHEWSADEAEAQLDQLQERSVSDIQNMLDQLARNEPVVIDDVAAMRPDWVDERRLFERLGIRSLIALPVMIDGQLIGTTGLDTSRSPRPFSVQEVAALTVLAELIGAALQHRQSSRRIRQVEAMREHAEHMAGMGSWQWDIEHDRFEASEEWCRVTGMSEAEVTRDRVIELAPETDQEQIRAHLAETLRSGRTFLVEHRIARADTGEQRWLRVSGELDLEDQDRPLLRGFSQDITEAKQVEQRMFDLAHFDYLTGLPNRMFVQQQIEQALARTSREGVQLALMFLDLDRFKIVNDTLGHDAGDAVLVEAGRRLADIFREQDVVARLGGDEFVVVLEGTIIPTDLAALARKIVTAFRAPFQQQQHDFVLTASVGIAVAPQDGNSASELLQKADTAMYHAKRSGRSRFQFITPEMNDAVARAAMIEEHIHGALARGEIRSAFQPIFNLKTGQLETLELLMRWEHPEMGNVPPDEFIAIAEQCGRIIELGAFVLEDGLSRLARWRSAGNPDLQLAINISPHQLRDAGLVELIEQRLHHAGLPGEALEVEITENVLLAAGEELQLTLARLRSLGVGISMDDFGTGYSSLSYLRDYPFTTLKIDRGFVRGLDRDQRKHQLVSAAIEMGHALDLKVIAEGVELEAELEILSSSDIDAVQGYLLSRPLERGQVLEFLRRENWPDALGRYLS